MMQIFNFFGSILGYLLWVLLYIFKNFGVSIIFFTIIIKFVLFPFSIKQQKSMAKTAKLQKKQKEIQKKYANNRQKANEEVQKLYQKEGVSPTGGCLTSIVPMLVMLGIFYSVTSPLTNTLHISSATVESAMKAFNSIPGMSVAKSSGGFMSGSTVYEQFFFVKALSEAKDVIPTIFHNATEAADVTMLVNGFNFLGFNLLEVPQNTGIFSINILIPVFCFVSSVGAQIITMRINGTAQNQQGCMKIMMIGLPLFSAYIAYNVPIAVGFYWICSSVFSLIQSIIMGKFFGPDALVANSEARHIALLEQQEAKVEYKYAPAAVYSDNKKNKKK